MIIIVTGIAKSGKSLIVHEIQQRFKLPCISTDRIMMDAHNNSEIASLDINASDSSVATILEPIIYEEIKQRMKQKEDCLFEGVHFNTSFARKLREEFANQIRIVYLGYKDINASDKVRELISHKTEIDNPWIFDHNGEKIEDIVSYLILESKRVYHECTEQQLKYIEVYNITKQMDDIIQVLYPNHPKGELQ